MIEVQFTETTVRLGERIRGTVAWTKFDTKTSTGLYFAVGWRTAGRGIWIAQQEEKSSLPIEEPPFAETAHYPFEISLPLVGPVSYTGVLLRVVWELTVGVDNAFEPDEVARFPFTVLPRLVARHAT